MKTLYNLDKLKNDYEAKGYLHIKEFFTKSEIEKYVETIDDESFFVQDINLSPEISGNPVLSNIFNNENLIEIVKKLSNGNPTYFGMSSVVGHLKNNKNKTSWRRLHTDTRGNKQNVNGRTYYDPSKKRWPVFDIYIYLEDFKNYSGCLKVVEGSHKKFLPSLGNFFKVFFNIKKLTKFDGKYSFKSIPFFHLFKNKNLKTSPGDIVIFNHAIHHSPNSLIIKKFPNISLPVIFENILEKFFPKIFLPNSAQRRIITICFGEESEELENFIRSRVQYLNKDFLKESKFFHDKDFIKKLSDNGVKSNLLLKNLLK